MRIYQKIRQGKWHEKGEIRFDRAQLKEYHRREILEMLEEFWPDEWEEYREEIDEAMYCHKFGPCRSCKGE